MCMKLFCNKQFFSLAMKHRFQSDINFTYLYSHKVAHPIFPSFLPSRISCLLTYSVWDIYKWCVTVYDNIGMLTDWCSLESLSHALRNTNPLHQFIFPRRQYLSFFIALVRDFTFQAVTQTDYLSYNCWLECDVTDYVVPNEDSFTFCLW